MQNKLLNIRFGSDNFLLYENKGVEMAKRVDIDERLRQHIETKCGADVDTTKFVAYQARIISTEPISQNTIYDGATTSAATITELEQMANDPLRNTCIQTMHDNTILPVGRLIVAKAVDEFDTGARALYGTFIVSTEHEDIISKLDAGIIDEVSIGFSGKKLVCSECDKDFKEADEMMQWMAAMAGVCPHCEAKFGKNGAHLNIIGVDKLYEVSLVGKGAARNPKILDKSKQLALAANQKQIKASLSEIGAQVLNLSVTGKLTDEKENTMDLSEVMTKLTELSDRIQQFEDSVNSRLEELANTESAAPVEAPVEEPAAEVEEDPKPAEEAPAEEEAPVEEASTEEDAPAETEEAPVEEVSKVEAELSEMKSFMLAEVNKVLVASGAEKLSEDASFESIKNALEASKLTLAASIPVGGVANAADSNAEEPGNCKYSATQLAALKLKK